MEVKFVFVFGVVFGMSGAANQAFAQQPLTPVTAFDDGRQGAGVLGAFVDSLKLLAAEHGIRLAFQEKTRRELTGPFWQDYTDSLRVPRQWEDSDAWWVNYLGHPIHGAAAGYIWLDHEPREVGRGAYEEPRVARHAAPAVQPREDDVQLADRPGAVAPRRSADWMATLGHSCRLRAAPLGDLPALILEGVHPFLDRGEA